MFLIYTPDGQDEQVYTFRPNEVRASEAEIIERLAERTFTEVVQGVLGGDARCRRAVLFAMLKRAHPSVKFADVDFGWGELTVEMSKQEHASILTDMPDDGTMTSERERIRAEMETARDDAGAVGKARSPIIG